MLKPFAIRTTERDKKRFKRIYKDRPSKEDSQARLFRDLLDAYEAQQKAPKVEE